MTKLSRLSVYAGTIFLVALFSLSALPGSFAYGSILYSPSPPNLITSKGFLAGYGDTFSSSTQSAANSSFTVPSVKCNSSAPSAQYSFFFAALETTNGYYFAGISIICGAGSTTPFIEGYVGISPYYISSFTASPGDKILATVLFTPTTGSFIFFIDDITTGKIYQTGATITGISAVAGLCVVDSAGLLADFGTVSFGEDHTGINETCYLYINGTFAPVGSFGAAATLYKFVMVSGKVVMAKPSALSKDGTSFKVTWLSEG